MKIRNKLSAIFAAITALGLLAGCAPKMDASAYVKSVLDVRYKNDSTAYVEMKFGTKEEAEAAYAEVMDNNVNGFVEKFQLSEELADEFRQILADISASVKYTVGEAVKQDDGSYLVTVTYEKMNFFLPFLEEYRTAVTAKVETLITEILASEGGEYNQAEMEAKLQELEFGTMAECMRNTLTGVTYQEPQTATVTVRIENNTLSADESDLEALDALFYDSAEADM